MSKTFFEIFTKYNPMNLVSRGHEYKGEHYHHYLVNHGSESACQEAGCDAVMTNKDYEDFFTQPIEVQKPKYETVELNLTDAQRQAVEVVMLEGSLRDRENQLKRLDEIMAAREKTANGLPYSKTLNVEEVKSLIKGTLL